MKKGHLQIRYNKTESSNEINKVVKFSGLFSLIRAIYKALKQKPDSILIFKKD